MTVTLDNPPRNFMTGRMVRELDELVSSLEDDASIGSVVITGAPDDTFITHFDVREILIGSEAAGQVPAAVAGGACARLARSRMCRGRRRASSARRRPGWSSCGESTICSCA